MKKKTFEVGKEYHFAQDYDRKYTLDAIYGIEKNTPSQGVLYIISELGRVPKTVRRAQYTLTEDMAQRDLTLAAVQV
jgi:hypothetical protein